MGEMSAFSTKSQYPKSNAFYQPISSKATKVCKSENLTSVLSADNKRAILSE